MFQKSASFLLFLLLITGLSASVYKSETITIKNSVDMRNGPGSYYQLILRLKSGAEVSEIEQEQQWLKVKTDTNIGWIPERSVNLEDQKDASQDREQIISNSDDAFDKLAGAESDTVTDPYASPAQVAAAVKGFAKDFTSKKSGSQDTTLLGDFNNFVNPKKYERFRSNRLQNWSWEKAQSRFPLDTKEAATLNPKREKVGWGIANVIAQQGLVENRELQQYLTHITLVLAENSHRYETPIQVYILDSEEISGYAAPNGAIFVSKGVLELMESEAEFAFFAAHELAHIMLNHGVKETRQRESKITAEQRFEELEEELGDRKQKYKDAEEELTRWANQVYKYTIQDRLKEYEYEADYWGVAYTYRAGYNPTGGLNLLKRIYDKQGDFEDQIGLAKWQGTSLRNRIIKIDNQISELDLPRNFGLDYQSTFQRKLSTLDE